MGWALSGKQQTPHTIPIQQLYPHFRMQLLSVFSSSPLTLPLLASELIRQFEIGSEKPEG